MTNVNYQVWIDKTCQYDSDNLEIALSKAQEFVNNKDSFFYGKTAIIIMIMRIEREMAIIKGGK